MYHLSTAILAGGILAAIILYVFTLVGESFPVTRTTSKAKETIAFSLYLVITVIASLLILSLLFSVFFP